MRPAIHAEGVKDLRRALKALGKEEPKQLTKALKEGAELALPTARTLAPRAKGRLSSSLRASGAANRASIRSTLLYANAVHWGGTVGRGHELGAGRGAIRIKRHAFIPTAIDRHADQIVDVIGNSLEELAMRHGWH